MNEPLMLKKVTEGKLPVSRLKNVNLTHIKKLLAYATYEQNLIRILDVFADDLISINGGDYETDIRLFIDESGIDITVHKSYPFIFLDGSGPVEGLCFSFNLDECHDEKTIHQLINNLINHHLENNVDSWLYAKTYSEVQKAQVFYKHLNYVDKLLFDEPTLVKKCSYLQSIYQDDNKKHQIGKIKITLTPKPSPMVTVKFGWLYMAVTEVGLLIRSSRSHEEEGRIRHVLNKKQIEYNDVQEVFLKIYNQIYETSYTDVKDLLLVHDMMEI